MKPPAIAHGGRLSQHPPGTDGHTELTGVPAKEILAARHPVALLDGSRIRRAFSGRLVERQDSFFQILPNHVFEFPFQPRPLPAKRRVPPSRPR